MIKEYQVKKSHAAGILKSLFFTSFAEQNSVSNRKVASFTGKERDEETGLYYYGARYPDAKTSRWLTTDPALGEYMAGSSVGEGGIYNQVNFNLYHYAGIGQRSDSELQANNPVQYIDPDGKIINIPIIADRASIVDMINKVSKYKYKTDDEGNLIKDGNKLNGFLGFGRSETFSNDLDAGIQSSSHISIEFGEVYVAKNRNVLSSSVHEQANGGITVPEGGKISVVLSTKGGMIKKKTNKR